MVVHPIKAFKSNARDQETAGQGGAARRAFNSGACEQHHVIHRLSFRRASRVRLKAVLRLCSLGTSRLAMIVVTSTRRPPECLVSLKTRMSRTRLPDNIPAHQATLSQVELSVGRPPDPTRKRPPLHVDHVPNGPTNSAAITTVFPLRLCGGKPSVAVTGERRYGPSRLRVNADDDDDE